MPSISWTSKRSYPAVKKILQERTVFIKADPFLRKIHFKKVKKDHEEKMLSFFFKKKRKGLKPKTFLKNKPKQLQIDIKWTTKFKTLTVSVKHVPVQGSSLGTSF